MAPERLTRGDLIDMAVDAHKAAQAEAEWAAEEGDRCDSAVEAAKEEALERWCAAHQGAGGPGEPCDLF